MTPEVQAITEEKLIELADTMAQSALAFSAQGYDQFLLAREMFIQTTHVVFDNIEMLRDVHSRERR